MAANHCFVTPNLADQIVGSGWGIFQNLALTSFASAQSALAAAASFQFEATTPLSIPFNPGGQPGTFVAPDAPTREIPAFSMPPMPPEPDGLAVTAPKDPGAPPKDPGVNIAYSPPTGAPGPFEGEAPDVTVELEDIPLPEDLDILSHLPTMGELYAIEIPPVPDIDYEIAFDGVRPNVDFAPPPLNFGFVEQEYTSELLDAVTQRLIVQGQGGTGLPEAVWNALWNQARSREAVSAAGLVQGVAEEFESRGFTEASPIMARRMRQVRQKVHEEAAETSRGIFIQASKLELEQLRDFVAKGIALEQVMVGKHLAVQQRAFESAKFLLEAAINLYNAQVDRVKMEAEIYRADAQVYRDRIQAELTKAEIYKAQIEGQRAIGQINETLARVFAEQVRGVLAMVDIYRASIEAARVRGELNTQRLEQKRLEVMVFAETVRANAVEWEGYGRRVEAELGVIRGQELAVNAYRTSVDAWQTKAQVNFEKTRTEVAVAEMKLRGHLGRLEAFSKALAASVAHVDAEARALTAEAAVYEAGGRMAMAESASKDRSFELGVKTAEIAANLQLQQGRENLQAGIQRAGIVVENLRGLAQVSSNLAVGMSSAVNLSASISAGESRNTSCSESFNFNGEIADA